MNIEALKEALPSHAKDTRLNLSMILTEEGTPGLDQKQRYGIALSCAYAIQNSELTEAIKQSMGSFLSEEMQEATQSAAMIMAMNNVYYRFVHLVGEPVYAALPAKLRMNVIGNPRVEKKDFELFCLAVSALNGCGLCMESHVKTIIRAGISELGVQSAIRIAAVLNTVACGLRVR